MCRIISRFTVGALDFSNHGIYVGCLKKHYNQCKEITCQSFSDVMVSIAFTIVLLRMKLHIVLVRFSFVKNESLFMSCHSKYAAEESRLHLRVFLS